MSQIQFLDFLKKAGPEHHAALLSELVCLKTWARQSTINNCSGFGVDKTVWIAATVGNLVIIDLDDGIPGTLNFLYEGVEDVVDKYARYILTGA